MVREQIGTYFTYRFPHTQVTLRFRVQEHCEFVKKKKRKEESPTLVTETKIGGIPIPFSSKEKVSLCTECFTQL